MKFYYRIMFSRDLFKRLGFKYMKHKASQSKTLGLRRFKSFFGITPDLCSLIWNKINASAPTGAEPKHLLWSLFYLKQYDVEHTRRTLFHTDEKTIRKWTWIFIELLSNLEVVKFSEIFSSTIILQ